MRSHCAVYVDAGYLLAAAATRVTGTSLRGSIQADHERLVETLTAHATNHAELPLLRVHWYDSARHGMPDQTQEAIGLLPRVKLRLGRIGVDGEQKGVDLRIGLDLVAHARTAGVEVMYLVSGDDDLTEAVEEAQAHGVQVMVLAVPTAEGKPRGVSRHLQAAADGLELLDVQAFDAAVTPRRGAPTVPPAAEARGPVPSPAWLAQRSQGAASARPSAPAAGAAVERVVYSSTTDGAANGSGGPDEEELSDTIDQVAQRVLATWLDGTADRHFDLRANRPSIPQDVDRALLLDLSDALGIYDLSDKVRHQLRARFWHHVDHSPRA